MIEIPSRFDFYLTSVADWPASFFLDLALAAHAPLVALPQRLHVTANLRRPRPDGLRDRLEADELHAMEDAVTQAVDRLGGRYVGRITWQGRSDAVFYVPATLDDLGPIEAAAADYDVSLRLEPDPEWRFYREFLLPSPYQHQTMLNRQILAALDEHGDDGTAARQVDHSFLSRTPTPLEQLGAALEKLGFEIDTIVRGDDGTFALGAHRLESPAAPRMDELCAELFQLLPQGVRYDGWGCGPVSQS